MKDFVLPGEEMNQMPAIFVGHGSPMNAIEDNLFSRGWQILAQTLPTPEAIISISAHWETKGTYVTATERPQTIHDFGGFPQELYDVIYPAPGSLVLAGHTRKIITKATVGLDYKWGLDHGTWSVLKHMYPKADIPVIQLSLDYYQAPRYHYELAKDLASLRKQGILLLGSGNMVHNLRMVDWNNPDNGYDWADDTKERMKELIMAGNHEELLNYKSLGKSFALSIPTPEHFLPLLYVLALKQENENIAFFNDKTVMGSLAMTSVKIG